YPGRTDASAVGDAGVTDRHAVRPRHAVEPNSDGNANADAHTNEHTCVRPNSYANPVRKWYTSCPRRGGDPNPYAHACTIRAATRGKRRAAADRYPDEARRV